MILPCLEMNPSSSNHYGTVFNNSTVTWSGVYDQVNLPFSNGLLWGRDYLDGVKSIRAILSNQYVDLAGHITYFIKKQNFFKRSNEFYRYRYSFSPYLIQVDMEDLVSFKHELFAPRGIHAVVIRFSSEPKTNLLINVKLPQKFRLWYPEFKTRKLCYTSRRFREGAIIEEMQGAFTLYGSPKLEECAVCPGVYNECMVEGFRNGRLAAGNVTNESDVICGFSMPVGAETPFVITSSTSEKGVLRNYARCVEGLSQLLHKSRDHWEEWIQTCYLKTPSRLLDLGFNFNRLCMEFNKFSLGYMTSFGSYEVIYGRDSNQTILGALCSGEYEAIKNTLLTFARHQTAEGLIPMVVTFSDETEDVFKVGGGNVSPDSNGLLFDIGVYEYYKWSGDTESAKKLLPVMKKNIEFISSIAEEDYLLKQESYMDWHDMWQNKGKTTYSNVLYYKALMSAAAFFDLMGEDGKELRKKAQRVKEKINEELWLDDKGYYVGWVGKHPVPEHFSTWGNVLAILYDVADREKTNRIFTKMEEYKISEPVPSLAVYPRLPEGYAFRKVDMAVDWGLQYFGGRWPWLGAYDALARFKIGDADRGVELLEFIAHYMQDYRFPGQNREVFITHQPWSFTTSSQIPYAVQSSLFVNTIVKGLIGFEPLEPGCNVVKISPCMPESWEDLNAKIPTPKGPITIKVSQKKGRKTQQIKAPPSVKIVTGEDL
jgi:hypothetical protein